MNEFLEQQSPSPSRTMTASMMHQTPEGEESKTAGTAAKDEQSNTVLMESITTADI